MHKRKNRRVSSRSGVGMRKTIGQAHAILGVVRCAVVINVRRDVEGAGGEAGAVERESYGMTSRGIRRIGRAGEIGEVDDIDIYRVTDYNGIGADDPDTVGARGDGGGNGQRDRTGYARSCRQRRRKRPRRIRKLDCKLIARPKRARSAKCNAHATLRTHSRYRRNARNINRRT